MGLTRRPASRPIAASSVRLFFGLVVGLATGLVGGCAGDASEPVDPDARVAFSDGWLAMGTFFEADLRLRESEIPVAKTWLAWAKVELARLEAIYSRHDEASQLSRVNRRLAEPAPHDPGVEVGAELEAVLVESVAVWRATGGAFDVTVGPLVEVWQRAAEQGKWPVLDQLRRAKGRVGSDRLRLPGNGRLEVAVRPVRIDLDAVAKGAALDHVGAALARVLPDAAALLSFGQSSTLAIGDPDGKGWILAVKSSDPSGGELATLRLRDRAVSVSSSLGSVSEIAGQTVSHIIDPRTGSTVEGTVEAVVIADRATRADGWSTGLLVLGAQRSTIRLVEQAGLEAYVFDASGRTVSSSGWEAHLAQSAP
jgi:thiamine biosynthesis lipoprotein